MTAASAQSGTVRTPTQQGYCRFLTCRVHGTPFPREKLPFKSRSPSATPAGNISCQRFIPWLCHSPAASLSSRHRPKGTFVQQCLQTISCREARGNLKAQTTCVAGCKPHGDTSDTRTHTGLTPANLSLKGDFAQSQHLGNAHLCKERGMRKVGSQTRTPLANGRDRG